MKLPIIAALSISALTLFSCGGAKPANTGAIEEVATEKPRYGRYSNNITLSEYAQQDRLALLLTTSLGEATALTGMGNPKSVEVDEMYKHFGSKVILFPNPTFNRK